MDTSALAFAFSAVFTPLNMLVILGGTILGIFIGAMPGIKCFIAAVLGGIGNTAGAVLGGLLIGFIEIVTVALFPALSGYRDAFAFVVLILVLLVKPTGLLGEKTTEKV